MDRAIVAEFFRPPHGTTRLHALTVVEDRISREGKAYRSRTQYDVEWSRKLGYYLFHQSGGGGGEQVEIGGIFFTSGPAKVKKKQAQWVDGNDKPPWRSRRTKELRRVNKTRCLPQLPRHIDLIEADGGDLLKWLERTSVDVDAVYCSECRDWVRGDHLCKHCWWCDKVGWYSTPAERCNCTTADAEENHS